MSLGGEEYVLSHDSYTAVVTEVGGGLRILRHGGRDLVLGYGKDEVRPRFRGALLAPWPNRVVDGRYAFGGERFQLDITEPERSHALHGLVCWSRFDLLDSNSSSVVLGHRVVPRTGYPFCLQIIVRYAVDDDGLTCTLSGRNIGDRPLPYGAAGHPYLLGGPGGVDDWTLHLPADEVLEVTPDRLVPLATRPVAATGLDFREPRRLAAAEVDHAFTGLRAGRDGRVRAQVLGEDGRGVECEWDPGVLPWVQVHTADLPDPERSRLGLALEPMTCPPDSFNSGTDLVVLEPGGEHTVEWTLRSVE